MRNFSGGCQCSPAPNEFSRGIPIISEKFPWGWLIKSGRSNLFAIPFPQLKI
jgi:hypothetical protein